VAPFSGPAIAVSGLGEEEARRGLAGGRLALSGADVAYETDVGTQIEINGEMVLCSSVNVCLVTDETIDGNGDMSGLVPAGVTRHYAYVSNSRATSNALCVRLSLVAPTTYREFLYLGASGNAANWRFVGWVGTTSAPAFQDSESGRLVVNYYNRRTLSLRSQIGYNDNNAQTTFALNSATWTPLNGGTGASIQFVGNGEDAAVFGLDVSCSTVGAAVCGFGVSIDSSTAPNLAGILPAAAANSSVSVSLARTPSAGFRTLYALGMSGGVATTVIADMARNGAAADPPACVLWGAIQG
jgi:hypothetical protein